MVNVGQKLYEERVKKGLTLEEIEKAIKIKASFLSAIEKGEHKKLPSSAYAYGFVRNYAEFLGLPKNEILALFRREFDEEKVFKVLPEGLAKPSEFPIKRIKVQQAGVIIFFVFLAFLGYIIFQYRSAFINPGIEIFSPKESQVISSRQVGVYGKTDPNATIYVNDNSVSLDQDGVFKKNLDLFPGKTTITIKAVNRFGRETSVQRHIEIKTP
ncbi:MAG: helix-turn-helix domain-containing protein [Candidatus Levybacteria bacterium]|nr:helix-turn-helix domain-containing protein [Candidatus Levybacteria bacterium]